MRVIFTRNPRPQEGGAFKAGEIVDLTGPSLDRLVRRGAVEPYLEPPVRHATPATVPAPPPEPPAVPPPVQSRRVTRKNPKPKEG